MVTLGVVLVVLGVVLVVLGVVLSTWVSLRRPFNEKETKRTPPYLYAALKETLWCVSMKLL